MASSGGFRYRPTTSVNFWRKCGSRESLRKISIHFSDGFILNYQTAIAGSYGLWRLDQAENALDTDDGEPRNPASAGCLASEGGSIPSYDVVLSKRCERVRRHGAKGVSSRMRRRFLDLPALNDEPERKEQFHEREDKEKSKMGARIKVGSQAVDDPA